MIPSVASEPRAAINWSASFVPPVPVLDARWMIQRHCSFTRRKENAMSRHQVKIESHHRRRAAVVYVRSAAVPQGPEDLARVEYQRAQAWHARAWGWPEGAVQVIDEDLGRSGRSIDNRAGYQKLCDMVLKARGDSLGV
jgi:hypothetical protein